MANLPIIGGFSAETETQSGAEQSINCFPQKHQGKTDWRLRNTPGLRPWASVGSGPIRGGIEVDGRAFVVSGNKLYEVLEDGTNGTRGTMLTSTGRVAIDDNGFQIIVTDGESGYVLDLDSNAFTQITDLDFFATRSIAVVDGYAVGVREGTGQYFHSDLYNALNYLASDFAGADSNPDILVAVADDPVGLLALGSKSVEVYWNSGVSTQVFQRRQGAKITYGCAAPYSVCVIENSTIWLGRDADGEGGVYRLLGGVPQKLSSVAVDEALKGIDLTKATAFGYKQAGQTFYVLNHPDLATTFVFDLTTSMWHERRSFLDDAGTWGRWRAECHVSAFGRNIVGDFETGALYALDLDYFFDGASTLIRRERVLRTLFDPEAHALAVYSGLTLDMLTGVGLENPPYDNPEVIVQVSRDGGVTYGFEKRRSVGRVGERIKRIQFNRLSVSRDTVFKVVYTYPTPFIINGATVNARK